MKRKEYSKDGVSFSHEFRKTYCSKTIMTPGYVNGLQRH